MNMFEGFKLLHIAKNVVPCRHIANPSKLGPTHRVNALEKKFLVWTKKYKSVQEVPDLVPPDIVERARNRIRIKLANYMMVATIIGCLGMVYVGKQKHKRGESVEKMNMEWHRRMNAEQDDKK